MPNVDPVFYLHSTARREKFSLLCSLIALGTAGSSLTGWILDIPLIRSFSDKLPPMVPMTASSLLGLALALIFLSLQQKRTATGRKDFGRISVAFALISFSLGFLTLLHHVFDIDTGLNKFFIFEQMRPASPGTSTLLFSGYMSYQTALMSILAATPLLLRPLALRRRAAIVVQILPMANIAINLLAVVAYIHDITALGPTKLIGIALPTAIGFLAISFGTLSTERNAGVMQRFRSRRSDGVFLRWYTTFSIAAPVFITSLITWGENKDLYPTAFSASLYVVLTILSLFVMGLILAQSIERLERQRLAFEQAQARAALRESEESLRETKDRLEIALAASKMGTWEVNLLDDSAFLSEMAEKLFGLSSASSSGRHLNSYLDGVHPEDLELVKRKRREAIEFHRDLDVDFRCVWPDGTMRWLRAKGRSKYAGDGTPLRMGGTVMDITDEKSHQNTLETALRAAESANELKTTFLANMSHEIRTPLGAILGFTELLRDSGASEEDKKNYLQVISRNGKTLSQLLNDILDLSKVESGYLNVEILHFQLKELVEEVMSLLKVVAEEKNVSLTTEFSPNLPAYIGSDPVRLKQILINLVGNALKFTSRGGVILRIRENGRSLIFEIEDSGVGIESEKQKKLFQAFSQADDSTTRRFGGTGLGLLLSRRLASLLGGSVELKWSQPHVGSVFVATIENMDQTRVNKVNAERPVGGSRPLEGVRILVAEDSVDNQNLILRLLQREGAQVKMTSDGQECVKEALAHDYDIVLMDIQMPICDGYSATEQLRAASYTKPILALTAHAMNDVKERCERVGCNGHLTKPIDKNLLVRTILNFVRPLPSVTT